MATSDEFVIDKTLGEGAFGKVFLVTGSGDKQKVSAIVLITVEFKSFLRHKRN